VTQSPHASVKVEVDVKKFNADALAGRIRNTAREILLATVSEEPADLDPSLPPPATLPPPMSAI